jgi:peptidoglycan/LPS O-acetylase OafA/YrhL
LVILVALTIAAPDLSLMNPIWSTIGIGVFSIFFSSLIAECLKPGIIRAVFENPVLRWLGKISYGIYVYHLLLYGVFEKIALWIAPHAGALEAGLLLAGVAICGTLLIASLSFYSIESAFLSLKDRFTGRHGGAVNVILAAKPQA